MFGIIFLYWVGREAYRAGYGSETSWWKYLLGTLTLAAISGPLGAMVEDPSASLIRAAIANVIAMLTLSLIISAVTVVIGRLVRPRWLGSPTQDLEEEEETKPEQPVQEEPPAPPAARARPRILWIGALAAVAVIVTGLLFNAWWVAQRPVPPPLLASELQSIRKGSDLFMNDWTGGISWQMNQDRTALKARAATTAKAYQDLAQQAPSPRIEQIMRKFADIFADAASLIPPATVNSSEAEEMLPALEMVDKRLNAAFFENLELAKTLDREVWRK